MKKFIFTIVLGLILISSCSKEAQQDRIESAYDNAGKDITEEPPKVIEPIEEPNLQEFDLPISSIPESPLDKEIDIIIGPVSIKTYDPVTIPNIESSTNLYFIAKNTGTETVTLRYLNPEDMKPTNNPQGLRIKHFFSLQKGDIKLAPGETKTIEYMIAPEGEGKTELRFDFQILETGDKNAITITLRSNEIPPDDIKPSARIYGSITPIDNKLDVKIFTYSGRHFWRAKIDPQGHYSIDFPSTEDIKAIFGLRQLPYYSLEPFLLIEQGGYELFYQSIKSPTRGEASKIDIILKPAEGLSYKQIGELSSEGVYGYWWLLPNEDFSKLAAVQARHPPELNQQGHFLITDLNGKELSRIQTNTECWGFDAKMEKLAAGCHDGTVYVTDFNGNLLWEKNFGRQNREVELSHDGKYVFTGPYSDSLNQRAAAALIETETGNLLWAYTGYDEWLRSSRWSPDGNRIIAGFSGGRLVMLTKEGKQLWERFVGEFPLVLEIDSDYNIYAAGKNRELFSFDSSGNLRWRRRIPDHVVDGGSNNMDSSGNLIVFGTVGAWLYAYDKEGELLWRRRLPGELQGHNALDMTPDGKFIAVGTAGEKGRNVALFDRKGTLLWKHQSEDSRGSTWPYKFDHNHIGIMTVAISDDGKYIAAGYGDSKIRIFEIESVQ